MDYINDDDYFDNYAMHYHEYLIEDYHMDRYYR
jgi:hypothetical protein